MSSLFQSSGGKGVKFPTPGATITGTVSGEPKQQQQTEFGTDRPATWPDGSPKMQILVPLTDTNAQKEGFDDDGNRTLYVTSTAMKKAIWDAVVKAGAQDVEIGGKLTVTFTGTDPESKNPQNPRKLYSAEYVKPVSPFGASAAPAAAPAAPTQASAPAQAPSTPTASAATLNGVPADTIEKVRQVASLGALTNEQIAQSVGLTTEQVNNIINPQMGEPF